MKLAPGISGSLWLLLLLNGCASIRGRSDVIDAAREQGRVAIQAIMQRDHIPGVGVAVRRGDALVWSEGFGFANLETGTRVDRNSRFRLASLTKTVTAVLAERLEARNALDLHRPLCDYAPDLPQAHCRTTLAQLLAHRGGIRHYQPKDYDLSAPGGRPDVRIYTGRESELAVFIEDPLVAAPGERFEYSTFGYVLAGHVIERATGRDYTTLIRDEIAAPLRLDSLETDHMFELRPGRAAAYEPAGDFRELYPSLQGEVVRAEMFNSMFRIPAGGLIATAEDVAAFGSSLREQAGDHYGWTSAFDNRGRSVMYATGSQQGARAILYVLPDSGLVIVIMTNLGGRPEDIIHLAEDIASAFLAESAR